MALEDFLLKPLQTRTSYSPRQLRDKLATLRAGMAAHLPEERGLRFARNALVPKETLLAALDAELAAFAALDQLIVGVLSARQALTRRMPVLASAVDQLSTALKFFAGDNPVLRKHLGVAPGKKRRRLRPVERLIATAKLNQTRKQTGTAAKKPRRR